MMPRTALLVAVISVAVVAFSGCVVSLGDNAGFRAAKERLFSGGVDANFTGAYEEIAADVLALSNGTVAYRQKRTALDARTAAYQNFKLIEPLYSCVHFESAPEEMICPETFKNFSDYERTRFAISMRRTPEQVLDYVSVPFLSVGWEKGNLSSFSFSTAPKESKIIEMGKKPLSIFDYNESRKEINATIEFSGSNEGFCVYLGIVPRRRTIYNVSSDFYLANFSLTNPEGLTAKKYPKTLEVSSETGNAEGLLSVLGACFEREQKTEGASG